MQIASGSTKEELFQVLEKIDQSTVIDTVLKTGQKVCVTAKREHGILKNWKLGVTLDNYESRSLMKKGTTYASFYDAVANLDKEGQFSLDCSILCFCRMEYTRSWDGDILSYWYNIDPDFPYAVQEDGQPEFRILPLKLPESEFKIMMQSKMAFYCASTERIYPILPIAYESIAKLMDASLAFKYTEEQNLASALLLAEKLSDMTDIKFLYRDRSHVVKPVMAVMGGRYEYIPQARFFEDVLDRVSLRELYSVTYWIVSDEETVLEIELNRFLLSDYKLVLWIRTGDMPGRSMSVAAFAKLKGMYILLHRNTEEHCRQYHAGGMDRLLVGIFEEFNHFEKLYNGLEDKYVAFSASYLTPLLKIIGKRKSGRISLPFPADQIFPAQELFSVIMEAFQPHILPSTRCRAGTEAYKLLKKLADA